MSTPPSPVSGAIGQPRGNLPRWLVPAVFGAFAVAGMVAIVVLASRSGGSDAPPEPGAFATPPASRVVTAYDVREVAGDVVTLASAGSTADRPFTASIPAGAAVEVLAPATAGELEPGDWVTIIGIPNEVRNYSITSIVAIPAPQGTAVDGLRATVSGFLGHEANRVAEEVPIVGGEVVRIDAGTISLEGPDGPMTIAVTENAPLARVVAGTAAVIAEGDRIAVTGASIDDAEAVLVLPGGAR